MSVANAKIDSSSLVLISEKPPKFGDVLEIETENTGTLNAVAIKCSLGAPVPVERLEAGNQSNIARGVRPTFSKLDLECARAFNCEPGVTYQVIGAEELEGTPDRSWHVFVMPFSPSSSLC